MERYTNDRQNIDLRRSVAPRTQEEFLVHEWHDAEGSHRLGRFHRGSGLMVNGWADEIYTKTTSVQGRDGLTRQEHNRWALSEFEFHSTPDAQIKDVPVARLRIEPLMRRNFQDLWKEVTILRACKHRHIIDIYSYFAVTPKNGEIRCKERQEGIEWQQGKLPRRMRIRTCSRLRKLRPDEWDDGVVAPAPESVNDEFWIQLEYLAGGESILRFLKPSFTFFIQQALLQMRSVATSTSGYQNQSDAGMLLKSSTPSGTSIKKVSS